jgi:radical SAM superfamily enzyme YgiQ (UPF0313 family)
MSNREREILLVNPTPNLRVPNAVEPLHLLTIAGELEAAGLKVQILDGAVQEITPRGIQGFEYVGVTSATTGYKQALKILEICRDISRQTGQEIQTVIGGPHVSALPEESLNDGWDTVCACEADLIVADIFMQNMKGIVTSPQVTDLDSLPFPARKLINPHDYGKADGGYAITIMSTRGCPFDCSFCDKTIMGKNVRNRSGESIAEEILVAREIWSSLEYLRLYDDNFTTSKAHVYEVCEALSSLDIQWECNSRVDTVDTEMLMEMKRAGCVIVKVGEESTNPAVLKSIDKKINPGQAIETIKMIQKAKMRAHVYLMFGFPEDDWSSVTGMLEFLDAANPNYAQLSFALPLPNTRLLQQIKELGYEVPKDWGKFYYAGPEGPHTYLKKTIHLDETEFAKAARTLQEGFITWALNKGDVTATNIQRV